MNERFKQLLEQAATEAFNSQFVPVDDPSPVTDVIQEKFARRIVKHCIELCKQEAAHYSMVESYYCNIKAEALEEAANLIKQCFGIKE